MKAFNLKLMFILILINSIYAQQTGWQTQTNPLGHGEQAMLGRVEFVSATEGWISGSRGTLLHTTDSGANWILINPFPNDTLWSGSDPGFVMDWVNPNYGWKIENLGPVYGESKKVYLHKTTDGGNTWTRKILSETEGDAGVRVQFADENTGWVLIYNFGTMIPTFLKTTDGGETWFPFPGADNQLLYISPKVTPIQFTDFDASLGVLYISIPKKDPAGITYAVGTYGDENAAFTFGLGYGFSGTAFENKPIIVLGGEVRVSQSIKMISENWVIPAEETSLLSFGLRFFGESLASDFGFIYSTDNDGDGFPFVPWIGLVYNF